MKVFKTQIHILLLLSISLIMFSCGGSGPQKGKPAAGLIVTSDKFVSDKNTAGPGQAGARIPGTVGREGQAGVPHTDNPDAGLIESDYVIGPEDLLDIDVFQVDELKRTVRVSSSGYINLPIAGKINVTGLTVSQLEEELARRLERYLQEPTVSIFIREYRSQRITVLGAVKNPQVYNVTRQKFLLDMLSLSGGTTETAGDICYIQRGSETIVINLNDLLLEGDVKLNVPVFSGDIIHVSRGGTVFVNGAVNSPGSFGMQGTVTLTQAIAMAKGLQYEAEKSLRIYRDTGKETRDIIEVDYAAVLEEKSSDITLKDKDVVIVPKNGARTFFKGFVETLKGFISFGKSL
ncbi:MAG: hypothetical protein C4560_12595 [Nitrospiraceae bacterium]|nr:MAG: hypothetical protein C4560_12595 [Nitrospiraceae bacterium]